MGHRPTHLRFGAYGLHHRSLQRIHPRVAVAPRPRQRCGIELGDDRLNVGQLQQRRTVRDEEPDCQLDRRDLFYEIELLNRPQELVIALQRRPWSEGDKGRRQDDAGVAAQLNRPDEIGSRVSLGKMPQDRAHRI